ncbi:maleylpyruvate isomerase family mycothiol-dependent enzyme [Myceligenerans crystallogenes]|uniref:Maleylpyruvate isomerase family mycothiol-dependent enzyme n=1 Tax=Myceligenerans crystallogenes TaxID=316335 RepID=A0ABP4ZQP3_9MICO
MHDRIEFARADALAALDALTGTVRQLTSSPAACAEPSRLPGWTRGHVLAHIEGVTHALARQAEFAARGERIAPYDGGAEGRNAAIEAGSTRTPAEHLAALTAARERVVAAWPAAGSPVWEATTSYLDGPVTGCLWAWWREMRIHAVDANVGIGIETWDPRLLEHLREFLADRLPEGVVLSEDDGTPEGGASSPQGAAGPAASSSAETIVSGAPADVVAWLAGREPSGAVRATRGGETVPLPEPGAWPSAVAPAAR